MPEMMVKPELDKGLAHAVAAQSSMSFIDGEQGILEYVGIDIDSLARNSTFEETIFLLWHGCLPSKDELAACTRSIQAEYDLPESTWDFLRAMPVDTPPMHALRTLTSSLAHSDPECDDPSAEANQRKAIRLLAKMPAMIANYDRHRKGLDFIRPDSTRTIAASFLGMLNGNEPTETMAKALDVCLILHADHGFNASTFAALVTISTLSDMYSAVTTAIGTLKGPLHGGANEKVMYLLKEIGSPDKVDDCINAKLESREKIMGFGHRVYTTYDPRATYLKTFARQLAEDTSNTVLYQMSTRIEEIMEEAVGHKGIRANVDFYSATTYFSLGLEIDLFTPIFAMSRVSGWTGHCIEYLRDNRLMRPRCEYTGPHGVSWVPIENR